MQKKKIELKLHIIWIDCTVNSAILARFDVVYLLFLVAEQGAEWWTVGKGLMYTRLTFARERVWLQESMSQIRNISLREDKEPVLSKLPYLVIFTSVLYLTCTSLFCLLLPSGEEMGPLLEQRHMQTISPINRYVWETWPWRTKAYY